MSFSQIDVHKKVTSAVPDGDILDIVCQCLQEAKSCGQKEVSKQIEWYEQQSKLVLKLGASSVCCTTVVNQMLSLVPQLSFDIILGNT